MQRIDTVGGCRLRRLAIVAAITSVLCLPASIGYAADGEIIGRGSNEFGNVFVDSNGQLRANFDHLHDCAGGLSNCTMQVRWHVDNLDDLGWTYNVSSWINVADGQDYSVRCPGDGRFRARLETRLYWSASTTKTVELWGEYEQVVDVSGSSVYRMLGKFMFNASNGWGLRLGHKIETTTATYDFGPATVAAESAGVALKTTCG